MHRLTWLFVTVVLLENVFSYNVTNHFELTHHWLHHEMSLDELSSHFGLFDAKDVDPDSYRVITVNNIYHFNGQGWKVFKECITTINTIK
jgi:hypothetical protein